jgi:hypothetical protein
MILRRIRSLTVSGLSESSLATSCGVSMALRLPLSINNSFDILPPQKGLGAGNIVSLGPDRPVTGFFQSPTRFFFLKILKMTQNDSIFI